MREWPYTAWWWSRVGCRYNGPRQVFSNTHPAYSCYTSRALQQCKSRCRQSIVIGHEFLLLSSLLLVIVFVLYRYYIIIIIIMIDYKNVIFYIAERDGVLLCIIIIISIIIVYPSGDNVITRAHSRRAFGSRDAVRWVLGIPAEEPDINQTRDRWQAQNKYHHGPRCLLKKQYQFRLAIHGRVWIIRPLSALTRARLSWVLAELYIIDGETNRKGY